MRRRLILGFLSILLAVTSLLVFMLDCLGVLSLPDSGAQFMLEQQLAFSADHIDVETEQLAAHAVEFSEHMTAELKRTGLSFQQLRCNPDALFVLLKSAYDTVYTQMRLASCSGAFYMLNATVNDSTAGIFYNGIYLKYSNVSSDADAFGSVCMYRGSASIARENDIRLYSTWQFETEAGTFPQVEACLSLTEAKPAKNYYLTVPYKLPDAWERSRFLCAPILDADGAVVGVCGFEISDLFFRLDNQTTNSDQESMLSVLLTAGRRGYEAQFSGSHTAYIPHLDSALSIRDRNGLFLLSDGNVNFIGKAEPLRIGSSSHIIATILPESDYDAMVQTRRIATAFVMLLIAAISIFVSVWLSKRYVRPLLRAKAQLASDQLGNVSTKIPEIDDLFAFLAQKDREREEQLAASYQRNTDLSTAVEQLRAAHEQTKSVLARISDESKRSLDPDSFALFTRQLKTLTPREHEVFDLYIAGKNSKEIMQLLGIGANGLKFHNRNIYSKLGVQSKKELLRYAEALSKETPPV